LPCLTASAIASGDTRAEASRADRSSFFIIVSSPY
jgi:hypothetical protein